MATDESILEHIMSEVAGDCGRMVVRVLIDNNKFTQDQIEDIMKSMHSVIQESYDKYHS